MRDRFDCPEPPFFEPASAECLGEGSDARMRLLDRTQELAARLSHLGVGPDLATLSLADLWGVYRFLCRMANG